MKEEHPGYTSSLFSTNKLCSSIFVYISSRLVKTQSEHEGKE